VNSIGVKNLNYNKFLTRQFLKKKSFRRVGWRDGSMLMAMKAIAPNVPKKMSLNIFSNIIN
jgi:hypothetical protein